MDCRGGRRTAGACIRDPLVNCLTESQPSGGGSSSCTFSRGTSCPVPRTIARRGTDSTLVGCGPAVTPTKAEVTVPGDAPTIAAALDLVSPGGVIEIAAGQYD